MSGRLISRGVRALAAESSGIPLVASRLITGNLLHKSATHVGQGAERGDLRARALPHPASRCFGTVSAVGNGGGRQEGDHSRSQNGTSWGLVGSAGVAALVAGVCAGMEIVRAEDGGGLNLSIKEIGKCVEVSAGVS